MDKCQICNNPKDDTFLTMCVSCFERLKKENCVCREDKTHRFIFFSEHENKCLIKLMCQKCSLVIDAIRY